jgi:hypothetical protein
MGLSPELALDPWVAAFLRVIKYDIETARRKECSMLPSDFRPVYDDSVTEYLKDDPMNRSPATINAMYCLMPSSAKILASLFSPAPKIVMAPPVAQAAGSPFVFNRMVPWLQFETGGDGSPTLRNAGLLASYWGMAGVPYEDAMKYALLDVGTLVEGQ